MAARASTFERGVESVAAGTGSAGRRRAGPHGLPGTMLQLQRTAPAPATVVPPAAAAPVAVPAVQQPVAAPVQQAAPLDLPTDVDDWEKIAF